MRGSFALVALGTLVALGALGALATPAAADDIARGSVLKVDHQEIYVNLGRTQAIHDGAALRIKRPIRLRHPVTRAAIEDWLPIGAATVTQAGSTLSRAIVGQLIERIRVGDLVEVLIVTGEGQPIEAGEAVAPIPPASGTRPAAPAAPPVDDPQDPVTAAVLAAFTAQTGSSLDARIAAWEQYLSTHGGSRFAPAIREDLDLLHALREQLRPPSGTPHELAFAIDHDSPEEADLGRPLPVVFVLARPERVASAYLHYRTRGARTYARALLVREHDLYLRGSVPAEVVRTPGVDYFVEVTTPNGGSGLALGSPSEPIGVEVKPPPRVDHFDATRGRSSVTLAGEYLDLATFDERAGDRRDRLYSATLDVAYTLDATVQRVGVGYGVIAGEGGFEDRTWEPANPLPRAGFHYGHADVEVGRRDRVVGGKLFAGVGKRGFGMGIEGRARIGARDSTSLTITARNLPELGWLADVRFAARPAGDLLVGITVGATDQPNRGDVAAKLGTELEWIGSSSMSLLVRGSWQGRSTRHGGLGGGAAVGFTW